MNDGRMDATVRPQREDHRQPEARRDDDRRFDEEREQHHAQPKSAYKPRQCLISGSA